REAAAPRRGRPRGALGTPAVAVTAAMPSGPARGGIERSRELLERAVGQELPFDDNVLGYLVKAASASDYQEVLDLVCDFCPRWHEQNQASLARHLIEVEDPR
ncbi:unnamed protein product, partial [Prorocentrum cordatum]